MTQNVRHALDEAKMASGIFMDLEKGFENSDYGILLSKPTHYSVTGVSKNWLKNSSMNDFDSSLNTFSCRVRLDSVIFGHI